MLMDSEKVHEFKSCSQISRNVCEFEKCSWIQKVLTDFNTNTKVNKLYTDWKLFSNPKYVRESEILSPKFKK